MPTEIYILIAQVMESLTAKMANKNQNISNVKQLTFTVYIKCEESAIKNIM